MGKESTYEELLTRISALEKENAQYKLREKFAEPDKRFKDIVDNVIVGIAIASPEGKLLIVNKAYEIITGYSEQELVGMNFKDFTHPEDILLEQEMLVQVISTKSRDVSYEKRYITKQGQVVWVNLSVSYIEGKNPYFIGVVKDVTEQRRIEKLLRKREEEYRRLYNNTPVMMHAIDMDGKLITVNDFWLKKLKYQRFEVLGCKSTEFLSKSSQGLAKVRIRKMLKEGEIKDVEYEFVDKEGKNN